jgi:hypothetical protein
MFSRKLIIDVNSVLALLHREVLGVDTDISEAHNTFIYRFKEQN